MPDVVVIGGGHNGLVAAARLASAGLDVVVFERLPFAGGMAGYRHLAGVEVGVGAYVVGPMPPEVRRLVGVGLEVPDPVAVYEADGMLVRWWRGEEARRQEFAQWGLADEVEAFWRRVVELNEAMRRYLFREPPTREELLADPQAADLIRRTGRDVLAQHLPSELWPMFLYEFLLDQPAYLLAYFNPPGGWGRPTFQGERGMPALVRALLRAARAAGARVELGLGVRRIAVRGGRAVGVVLDDGRLVEAKAVLSTASPVHTLLDLAGPEHLDGEAERRLREAASLAVGPTRLNVLLDGPARLRQDLEPYRDSILQLPFGEVVVEDGLVSAVGTPDLEALGRYVQLKGVKAVEAWGPEDYRRTFNAPGAYVNHLPLSADFLLCRPACGWGYRTPVRGLYLGGAGTWPGGHVTGG